jgi:hypothetical protein
LEIRAVLHYVRVGLSVVLATVLVGCGLPFGGSLTVDQAIQEALSHDPTMPVLSELEIRVARQLPDATAVLFTYESEQDGEQVLVESSMLLERGGFGWFPGSSSSTWYSVNEPLPPISFGAGSTGGDGKSYANASGLVTDPAVHEVAVTFSDGSREVSLVENGAYLVAKAGSMTVTKVEALDVQGNVLHQQDYTTR